MGQSVHSYKLEVTVRSTLGEHIKYDDKTQQLEIDS